MADTEQSKVDEATAAFARSAAEVINIRLDQIGAATRGERVSQRA